MKIKFKNEFLKFAVYDGYDSLVKWIGDAKDAGDEKGLELSVGHFIRKVYNIFVEEYITHSIPNRKAIEGKFENACRELRDLGILTAHIYRQELTCKAKCMSNDADEVRLCLHMDLLIEIGKSLWNDFYGISASSESNLVGQ